MENSFYFNWSNFCLSQPNSPLRISKSTDIFPTRETVPTLTCASFDSLRIYERMNSFVQTLSSQPTSCFLFWCICAGSIGTLVSFQDARRTGKCIAHRARIWVIKRERLAVNGLSSALPLERDRHYTSSSCALYRIAHRTSKGKKMMWNTPSSRIKSVCWGAKKIVSFCDNRNKKSERQKCEVWLNAFRKCWRVCLQKFQINRVSSGKALQILCNFKGREEQENMWKKK